MTTIKEGPLPVQKITQGDNLREQEKSAAGQAVEFLEKATGRMTFIRDNGGKKADVAAESLKAHQETQTALEKIAKVHIMRRDQK